MILNEVIEHEMTSIRDSKMMKECLEIRLTLLKLDYSLKNEYDQNEVQILKMKTEFQIDKLTNLIQEKTLSFIDLMKIYVQELEEEFIQSK